jgi:hypothetical protein
MCAGQGTSNETPRALASPREQASEPPFLRLSWWTNRGTTGRSQGTGLPLSGGLWSGTPIGSTTAATPSSTSWSSACRRGGSRSLRGRTHSRRAARPGRTARSWARPPARSRATGNMNFPTIGSSTEPQRRAHEQRERVEGDHLRSSAGWSACSSGTPRRTASRGSALPARSRRTGSPGWPGRASRAPTARRPRA